MSDKYIVSARKYRPATFRSVVGQQNLTSTLKGAIASGRLAHAYLFCGPRGVGKTSCARIFARTINCLSPTPEGEACGQCESCRAIDRGNSFNLMELDAASNNSVDDIRAVTEQVNIPPQVGRYRVFIIDEVHMLSSQAFNAFLKTLEEPPSYVIFILATTEKHKVIPTILSRCQIYDFKRITINDMVDHLAYVASEEGIEADRRALGVIARKADGAMRDALSIFDQVATSSGGKLTYEAAVENLNVLDYDYFFRLIDTFARGGAPEALLLYKEIRDRGFDSLFFVNSLAQHVRDLMVAADARTLPLLEMPDDVGERLVAQARTLPLQWYYAAMRLLNECDLNYRTSSNKQLLVELTLIRLCQLLSPAQPPFDAPDRPVALRNPSEPPRATASSAAATPVSAPKDSAPAPSAAPIATQPQPAPAASARVAPAPASAPVAASQTAPAPQPRPASVRPRPLHSFQMNAGADTTVSSLERKKEAFTDAQFIAAWNEYIASVPDQKILVSAMRNASPTRRDNLEFDVLVDHPAQQQAFELAMPKLLRFLRERLRNDFLTVKAMINPEKEVVRQLSPQDFLRKAVTENAALGEFLKEIEIELC
ncbi:MAG: DNA polymerase III subunit gamma/tau [Muribaculaceae bacterium]|nr:DNA polymerase III subunit gamma/tau [Muribaculaceae bacterium]